MESSAPLLPGGWSEEEERAINKAIGAKANREGVEACLKCQRWGENFTDQVSGEEQSFKVLTPSFSACKIAIIPAAPPAYVLLLEQMK